MVLFCNTTSKFQLAPRMHNRLLCNALFLIHRWSTDCSCCLQTLFFYTT